MQSKSDQFNVPHAPHNGSHPSSRHWSLLIWLGVVGLSAWLFLIGGSYDQINGTVDFKLESVSSLEEARVKEILVDVDQYVTEGTPLAQMDTSPVDEEIEALQQTLGIELLERQRRFTQLVQDTRREINLTKVQLAQDKAELEVLENELKHLEELLQRRLVDRETIIRQKARVSVLKKNLEELPKILGVLSGDLSEAEKLQERSMQASMVESSGSTGFKQLDMLVKRKERYTLRAANNGTIAQLLKQPGEIVTAGEPVVKLVIEQQSMDGAVTKLVRGFLPERFAFYAEKGTRAIVYTQLSPDTPIEMEVASVTPHLLSVPDQASALPNSILRGRTILLHPLAGQSKENIQKLLPGESVVIRMKPKTFLDLLKQL